MDEEYRGYGYPFPSTAVRIEQLDEGLRVMKLLFTEGRASFEGKYYSLADAANNPKPVQKPYPPILIGGAGEKLLLRVVARHADIWNCPNNVAEQLPHKLGVLRRHCDAVKRNPDDIEVSEQCIVVLGKDEADLKQKLGFAKAMLGSVFDIDKTGLIGTPAQLIDRIEARAKQGVTFFTMLFGDLNAAETLELFAEQVAPVFR
jgi:alkanesulfonate monooxygenase SsuD/methylene tetrahydromethanopterin reductase-like flavin-dependent oxidoreductase (luciferase family)